MTNSELPLLESEHTPHTWHVQHVRMTGLCPAVITGERAHADMRWQVPTLRRTAAESSAGTAASRTGTKSSLCAHACSRLLRDVLPDVRAAWTTVLRACVHA